MKSTKLLTNFSQTHQLYYEPYSVLDPHITSSPAAAGCHNPHGHDHQFLPLQPPSDEWDSLSCLLSEKDVAAGDLPLLPASKPAPLPHPFPLLDTFDLPSYQSFVSDDSYESLLRAAAESIDSDDFASAKEILARLNQNIPSPAGTSLRHVAFHFKEALHSLLAAPDRFLAPAEQPPSAAELVGHICAQRAFACLSPIPQFASFTANQTLLEIFEASTAEASSSFHIIDFDLGLGGQWSSFIEEAAARGRSLHHCPTICVTAVVHEETAETSLASENLRDFAQGLAVPFTIDVVRLGGVSTFALGSIRLEPGEPVVIVLSPAIFRHLSESGSDLSDALLPFIHYAAPRIIVFVDADAAPGGGNCMGLFTRSVESCVAVMESVQAAAAAISAAKEAVRRVQRTIIRPMAFAAVRSWWGRREPWKEIFCRAGWGSGGGVPCQEERRCLAVMLARMRACLHVRLEVLTRMCHFVSSKWWWEFIVSFYSV